MIELRDHRDQAGAWDVLEAASGSLAFDIGANLGQSTAVLARHFAQVVALEPCAESFAVLRAECAPNVIPLPFAASSRDGRVCLAECSYSISTGQLTSGPGLSWGEVTGHRSVPCLSLRTLASLFGAPDFVKIDTEGHEVEVLRGGPLECQCQVLVEVHQAENEDKVRLLLDHHRLTKLTHDPTVVDQVTRRNHFWLTGWPA